tara:strand:+ start:808 stop:987 length:180 start_codon:yes stop_codon:yes gene_type:complete
MEAETVEIECGKSGVIIEFPSRQAANDSYNSLEYQELRKSRWANLIDTNNTNIDGGITH